MHDEIIVHLDFVADILERAEQAEALAAHYQAALERIAQPGTGYQVWHTAEARRALDTAPGADT